MQCLTQKSIFFFIAQENYEGKWYGGCLMEKYQAANTTATRRKKLWGVCN